MELFNLKKLIEEGKENPGTLFGFLYPYVLIIILAIGLYYLANIDEVAQQNIPPVIPDSTEAGDLKLMEARDVPPIDINKISKPSEELLMKGKELYNNVCASCHNESGAGGGPASKGLNPAPRAFTQNEGWKNGRTLSAIYTTLEEGIEGSAMISYNYLTPEERFALAHYIREEFVTDAPPVTVDELTLLDQVYNLSEGVSLPAQIPVEAAIKIISKETEEKISLINYALEKLQSTDNMNLLFKNITIDKQLALSALANSDRWRTSEASFISFITSNVNQNGFNGRIFNLSNSEWSELYDYLKNII